MILITALLFASICAVVTLIIPEWVVNWYDFWIPICAFFIGGLVVLLIAFMIIVISSWCVDTKKPVKPSKYYMRLCKRVAEFLLQISRVKVMVRGIEKVPSDKKFLLVTNHQSNFDALVILWTMRAYDISFIMKESLLKLPIFGKCLYGAGFLGLNRSNDREGLKTIIQAIHWLEEDKCSIQVCPEGTRSKSFNMGEFHHGTFKVALKSKCPIVVAGIQNTCCICHRFPFRSTTVYYDIIDVLPYDAIENMTTQEISDISHKMISDRIEEFPKEKCKLLNNNHNNE